MKHLTLIIILTLILSGCASQKRCARLYPSSTDSTVIVREITQTRDTTIYVYIKPDTVTQTDTVTIVNGLPESAPIWANVEFARAKAQVKGGQLLLQLFQEDTAILRVIEDAIKYHSTEKIVYVDRQLPPIEVNRLTSWQSFQMWAGRIALAVLLLWLLIKILDKRIRIL